MNTPRIIIRNKGLKPIKKLGQTFLEDRNVASKIIRTLDAGKDDVVVEIGAGLGIMTEEIAAQAGNVIALEIDSRLVNILKERFADFPNVEIIQCDVLDFDFSTVNPVLSVKKLKIIGNIPYNISSQILFRLIHYRSHISKMVLMFQKELADRLCAAPGSKEYGIPSVLLDMYTLCTRELNITKQCFYPQPKVMSSVLNIIIRDEPRVDLKDHDFFVKIVRTVFSKRRKTILNNLKSLLGHGYSEENITQALQLSGIDGGKRGETLSAEEFGILCNVLYR